MRITHALVQVTAAFMADPDVRHWGYSLWRQSGVRSGVLYPMLYRMVNDGLLTAGWEDPATIQDRRPLRRYYELTPQGRVMFGRVLDQARGDRRFTDMFSAWGLSYDSDVTSPALRSRSSRS